MKINNMLTKYTLFLLALFILGACEKEIEFKGEIVKPILVVNSLVNPDSVMSVHVSKSRFNIGRIAPPPNVENAVVTVYVNDELKEKLSHTGSGIYKGAYRPKPSDKVRVEVVTPEYAKVEAQGVLPKLADCRLMKFDTPVKETVVTDSGSGLSYREKKIYLDIRIVLSDDAQQDNYYFLRLSRKNYYSGIWVNASYHSFKLSEVLENRQIIPKGDSQTDFFDLEYIDNSAINNIFTDELVNGKEIGIRFQFKDYYNDGSENAIEYEVEIAQMSRDLYLYIVSANKMRQGAGETIFSEPVQVHSNITNGAGILGAYTIKRFSKRVEN